MNTGKRIKQATLNAPRDISNLHMPAISHNTKRQKRFRNDDGIQRKTNWLHPILWPLINAAAIRHNFMAASIVKDLQLRFLQEGHFNRLWKSTVHSWIETDKSPRTWKPEVLKQVETGTTWKPGTGRIRILDPYPEVIEAAKKSLLAMRQASLPVNVSIARHILLGIIQSKCPQILSQPRNLKHSQDSPVLSIWTVRDFLRRELNWTVRCSTKAGQKLPVNWEELCEKTFFRFVTTILKEDIHQSLLINLDQTGIILIPGGTQCTYDEKGIRQVALYEKEEKWAFTVVLITSANGLVLSVQAVWKGKSERFLPALAVDKS